VQVPAHRPAVAPADPAHGPVRGGGLAGPPLPWLGARRGSGEVPPPALEIAGLYRDLRKGLEDTKNEPGAADFYYGEMEMRRLAAREASGGRGDAGDLPPRSERWLLHAYWALSGYGLRASRALATLAVLLLVSAWLFTFEAFAQVPKTPDAAGFSRALEFSARSSLSLLRGGSELLDPRGPGTVLDMALRLLGPVLLALAVLAIRGRTKR
jgi:hypothetical protein